MAEEAVDIAMKKLGLHLKNKQLEAVLTFMAAMMYVFHFLLDMESPLYTGYFHWLLIL
jgi:hypothetical protein